MKKPKKEDPTLINLFKYSNTLFAKLNNKTRIGLRINIFILFKKIIANFPFMVININAKCAPSKSK